MSTKALDVKLEAGGTIENENNRPNWSPVSSENKLLLN